MHARVRGLWSVVLAAGGSSRLGEPKQLLRRRGKPLLTHTAELAQTLTPDRVVVVVGASPYRMRSALRHCRGPIRVVTNARWRDGMSTSLCRGLAVLPPRAAAVLLLAVDQPLVGHAALARLIAAWSRHPQRPAAASYAARLGVPAILPRRLWPQARRASGDVGARDVLRGTDIAITAVEMPEAGFDIDTQEDLAHISHQAFAGAERGRALARMSHQASAALSASI